MILAEEPESPLNARSAALGVRSCAQVICMPPTLRMIWFCTGCLVKQGLLEENR